MKATGLFGSVQIVVIIISLIRGKFTAVLLGAEGFGIYSLLTSPIALLVTLTGLGISYSAVKDMSKLFEDKETLKLTRAANVFRYWVIITGVLGVIVTILISPLLSKWSFGNYSYTYAYIILSFTLLFSAISNGQLAYLRSIRQLSATAKASVFGPFFGLVFTVPLYYYFNIDGIVPVILLLSVFTVLSSSYFFKKHSPAIIKLKKADVLKEGKGMIKLGIVMTIAGLLSQLVGYLVILFISKNGGVTDVGLYNAGMSLTIQYVGLILSAMAVDYFPRLAAINDDNIKVKEIANQQAEIILLLLAPILIIFLLFLPIIIKTLFSNDFIDVIPFVKWTALGMFFRAISWTISFIPGAKGDTKLFLVIEFSGSLIFYLFSIIGYNFWKLEGVGVAFLLNYIIYFLIVYFLCYNKYNFGLNKSLLKILFIQSIMLSITFICLKFGLSLITIVVLGINFIACLFYSLYELNKRMDLLKIIKK